MSHNNYFQFKQFMVEQNHAAMRVGTDGVLLGAWTNIENATNILDIGTGTGVIALMLAQRSSAQIDAIDIEEGAIIDAKLNFSRSPWHYRLKAHQVSLQEYVLKMPKKFDCIVSNPPFFNNSIKSAQKEKAMARHTDALSFNDLISHSVKLMSPMAIFSVIISIDTEKEFCQTAINNGLKLTKITRVKPNLKKPCKRVLLQFELISKPCIENQLTIETAQRHEYTSAFTEIMKPFYLQL